MIVLKILGVWAAVSVPFSILLGMAIKVGSRTPAPRAQELDRRRRCKR